MKKPPILPYHVNGRSAREKPLKYSKAGKLDIDGVKRIGHGARAWIRIDKEGNVEVLEMDKFKIMRRCNLPARDFRLLDPLFVYPSTILRREKAIVVSLEQIRCIITADEVLLLNSLDAYVVKYVKELQGRIKCRDDAGCSSFADNQDSLKAQFLATLGTLQESGMPRSSSVESLTGLCVDDLPFEFKALEVALESSCTYLNSQAIQMETESYPVLDELTTKLSSLNLERVRKLKSRLMALTRRVQKVRDEIEHLMDDDKDMAEMYLTERKEHMETEFTVQEEEIYYSTPGGANIDLLQDPVSPHAHTGDSDNLNEDVQKLEMLLEAYFVLFDFTLNKLCTLKEYIDDTEDFLNIQLDNDRNHLIQFDLVFTAASFVLAMYGVVAGVFGMNFPIDLFDNQGAFKWVLIIAGILGLLGFCGFLLYLKSRRLLL